MSKLAVACGLVVVLSAAARADVYQLDCVLGSGDPNGSRAVGTQKLVSCCSLCPRSDEEGTLLVGSQVQVGQRTVPVGRELSVVPTTVDGGGVKVRAVLRVHTLTGQGAAAQVTTTSEEVTATIQPGGKVRVQIGKDPKNLLWADVTVRKAD